jgi:SAM-dependent methyltransferase
MAVTVDPSASAVDAAAAALAGYAFYRVPEAATAAVQAARLDGSGGGGANDGAYDDIDAAAAAVAPTFSTSTSSSHHRPCVLLTYSTASYRRLARCIPRAGELTVDIGSAYGDATALMASAAGEGNVLGLDVGSKFVAASKAKHPGLRFEQVDALEDPAFLARGEDSRRRRGSCDTSLHNLFLSYLLLLLLLLVLLLLWFILHQRVLYRSSNDSSGCFFRETLLRRRRRARAR